MEFLTDYRAERFALSLTWEDIPTQVQERARMCGIDLLGALVLGSKSRQFAVGTTLAQRLGLHGTVPVIGTRDTYNLLGASIACGHAANSFDIDDGFNLIKGHPGSSFVGGALPVAAEANCSWRDYLTTLVVCYELTMRWAFAMQNHYGFLHSSGAYGAFGTALAIARQRSFDERALNNALSIADFHAPMVPVMRSVEYPSMNKDGIPFGTLVGAMAALETQAGETGRGNILELPEYTHLIDTLGNEWLMEGLYFKPYTCCRWAHQPIECCLELIREHDIKSDGVTRVCVHTFDAAARLSKAVPHDTEEAQYNIAYPVACAMVHGDVGYDQIRDEALNDPDVIALMGCLEFVVDEVLEEQFPEKRLAWVEIELKDGTTVSSTVRAAPGEFDDPTLGLDWVISKFRRRTRSVLGEKGQECVLMSLADDSACVRDVIDVVNGALGL